ncbi:unnamed protein product [Litomosoides sigmodontis]|uniref:G-protein coupled receptors family 1 profile domain-containing protein n=1 Tax=Litomosoides sigmodontis TaxID=42156 RepID=A0A3P7KDI8_LITSI|nr:unnamed protein product [Litomosoides sigmodontis]
MPYLSAIQTTDLYYCDRRFHARNLRWVRDCTKSHGAEQLWTRIRFLWALAVPNIMFVMYVAIFYSIRRKRQRITTTSETITGNETYAGRAKDTRVNYYERSMLIQAAWNCGTAG